MAKTLPEDDDVEPKGEEAILVAARKAYERCVEAWEDNQAEARDDLKFGRLGDQWDDNARKSRMQGNVQVRPMLTFNKMPAFIRQVVNDARQNKPSIKVHPQDSGADPKVAEIINGLIRNIEVTSDADVAYDTAIEHAVGQGFGFWRINTAYTSDEAFDQDIVIERISNPFTVYGDPRSTAADSSDWNVAFIRTSLSKAEFKREYPGAERVNWDHDFGDAADWLDGENVVVAEYWTREKVKREIVALSDGTVREVKEVEENAGELTEQGVEVVGEPREVESFKVTQRIMSGAEILKTVEWQGKYIPIVPVYGDEVIDEDGKRIFRSLIRDAKDPQRMFNYMRTTSVEALALAPRIPYVGKKGAFNSDPNWDTANSVSHPYLEFDGETPPQRQPLPPHFAAAFQEALTASDDMKSIIGIYDASLGARSNETSGRAIMARQREGDVSTFHFIDNLSRAIRHGGRILLDLIPKVYTTERIVRTLGEDLTPSTVRVAPTGQPVTEQPGPDGSIAAIYDLTAGKYDLTVSAGPSFTSRREEASMAMREMMQAVPDTALVVGDIWAKMQDWPEADKIAERLQALLPEPIKQMMGQATGAQIPPQIQQQMQQGMALIQQLQGENQQLKAGQAEKQAEVQLKARELEIKAAEVEVKRMEAETRRIEAQQPTFVRAPVQAAQ